MCTFPLRRLLPALVLLLAATAAQAEPRVVGVVLDSPPRDAAGREAVVLAVHRVLHGLGAVQDGAAVQVAVVAEGVSGSPSGQLSAWLADVRDWGSAPRAGAGSMAGVIERAVAAVADGPLVVIDGAGGAVLDAAAVRALGRRRVTVISDEGDCGGMESCVRVPLRGDGAGAAAVAVERALAGVAGVWVTTAGGELVVPPGVARVVLITSGGERAVVEGLGEGAVLGGAAPDRVVSAVSWRRPRAGAHGVRVAGGGRALVVGVVPRVVVTACDLADGDRARWRFAAVDPGWDEGVAERVRFAVSGRAGLLAADAAGSVVIPGDVVGAFTLTPVWVEGEAREALGETAECVAAPRLLARAVISGRPDGDGVVVTAVFRRENGAVIPANEVLRAGVVEARVAGGAAVRLVGAEGVGAAIAGSGAGAGAGAAGGSVAVARVPLPGPGTYRIEVSAVGSRALWLAPAVLEVTVSPPSSARAVVWWPALVAAVVVGLGVVGWPLMMGFVRQRRPPPVGVVSVAVGGSPVIERGIGPQTAYPAVLVGVRDIPIAAGESLARAEVRWEGWRPVVVATVMGRPAVGTGRSKAREVVCPLDAAHPFSFSNVRIEFVAEG